MPAEHNKVIVNIVKWTLIHILSNDRSRNIRCYLSVTAESCVIGAVSTVSERRLVNEGCSQSTMMHSSESKPQPLFNHLRGKLKYEMTRCNWWNHKFCSLSENIWIIGSWAEAGESGHWSQSSKFTSEWFLKTNQNQCVVQSVWGFEILWTCWKTLQCGRLQTIM